MALVSLGSKAVGSIVKLRVNGVYREFIVVNQGKPSAIYDESCNGTWLLMKDVYVNRSWYGSLINDYANSVIHRYLDSTLLNLFEGNIKNTIKQVKIPFRPGSGTSKTVNSGANGLSCKLFLLSCYEMGWTNSDHQDIPQDGAKLAYFIAGVSATANNKRIAYLNGSAVYWGLRSPYTYSHGAAWCISPAGNRGISNCDATIGVCPALVLPPSLFVADDSSVTTEHPPTEPQPITVPDLVKGASPLTIAWGGSSDADGNLAGYRLERSVNGGGWAQIYQGGALSFTDSIVYGWGTVAYRVLAYDGAGAVSGYVTSPVRGVNNNSAPGVPASIAVSSPVRGGQALTVNWGVSTDVDGNLAGYELEHRANSGGWAQIYRGTARTFSYSVTRGWQTVQYRVRAYDAEGATSAYQTSAICTVVNNLPPVISGADGALGLKDGAFSASYSVSDADGDGVTVTEALDGVQLRSFAAALGVENLLAIDAGRFQKLLNGEHVLTVTAVDNYAGGGLQSVRRWTFQKNVTSIGITLSTPLVADGMPERCVLNVARQIPIGATFTVEICNNGFDVLPTWETCTPAVLDGRKFFFANKVNTAGRWGVNLRVTVDRGNAVGDCYITGIGGNFE